MTQNHKNQQELPQDWKELQEEIERVHRGQVPEFRPIDMELVWKCLKCGHLLPRDQELPDRCPKCGAPETEFEAVIED
jgi:rubrerythrin